MPRLPAGCDAYVIPLDLRVMVSRPFPGGLREAEQFAPGGLGRCVCEVLSHAQLLPIVLDSPVNESTPMLSSSQAMKTQFFGLP